MLEINEELPKWKQSIVNLLKPYLQGWGLTTIEEAEASTKERLSKQAAAHEKQRYALRDDYECELSTLTKYLDGLVELRCDRRPCGCYSRLVYTLEVDERILYGCNPGDSQLQEYLVHLLNRACDEIVLRGRTTFDRPWY